MSICEFVTMANFSGSSRSGKADILRNGPNRNVVNFVKITKIVPFKVAGMIDTSGWSLMLKPVALSASIVNC